MRERPRTTPQVAEDLDVTYKVLLYALEKHGPPPAMRVGNAYVYTRSQYPAIRESLEKTNTRAKAAAK